MEKIEKIIYFIRENWDVILPVTLGLAELYLRIFPTKRNYSIIDKLVKVLNMIVPNKRIPPKNESTVEYDNDGNPKNTITVRKDRYIAMVIIFVLLSAPLFAQSPIITQERATMWTSPGTQDTTLIRNTRTTLQSLNGATGGLFVNETSNKYRMWSFNLNSWVTFDPGSFVPGSFWKTSGTTTILDETTIVGGINPIIISSDNFVSFGNDNNNLTITTSNNSFQGKTFFTATSDYPGINFGTFTGDPSTTENSDVWYNLLTDNYRVHKAGLKLNLVTSTPLTTNQMMFANGSGNINGDPDITITGGNTLTATNATITTALRNTVLNTFSVPIIAGGGIFSDSPNLTYNSSTGLNTNAAVISSALTLSTLPQFAIPFGGGGGVFSSSGSLTFTGGSTLNTNQFTLASTSGNEVLFNLGGLIDGVADFTYTNGTSRLSAPILNAGSPPVGPTVTFGDIYRSSNNYVSIVGEGNPGIHVRDNSNNLALIIDATKIQPTTNATAFTVFSPDATTGNAGALSLDAGDSNGGNGNGGDVVIASGARNGSGSAGDIRLTATSASGGYIIMSGLPTSCAGAPTGALANIAGVLNICP